MTRRRYTDEQRATALAALAANGGNVQRTARELGIPEPTLRHWATSTHHPDVVKLEEQKKSDLASLFDDFVRRVLELTSDEDIRAANLQHRLTSAGVAIDKARLLRGQPTTITDNTHRPDLSKVSDEDLETLERIARTAGPASHTGREGPAAAP